MTNTDRDQLARLSYPDPIIPTTPAPNRMGIEANPVTKPIEEVAEMLWSQDATAQDAQFNEDPWVVQEEYRRRAHEMLSHMSSRGMLDADTILALRNEEKEIGK